MAIGMIVAVARSLALHGSRLVLAAPAPLVGNALRMSGVDRGIPIAEDVARALELLDEA